MIFRSPHPDINIPDNLSLPDFIFQDIDSFADNQRWSMAHRDAA